MIELMAAMALVQAGMAPDPRLDAFRAACVPHRQDLEAAAGLLAAEGWVQVTDDDHPELTESMRRARAGMVVDPVEDPGLSMTATFSIWARDFGEDRFHVILNRVDAVIGETKDSDGDGVIQSWEDAHEMTTLGCGLWDFDAEAMIHPGLMTAWTGSLPVASVDRPGEIEGGTWNVYDLMPGTGEVKISFVPEGSPHVATIGLSGLAITMSSAPLDDDPPSEADPASPEDDPAPTGEQP
jgi:hypothetical protein